MFKIVNFFMAIILKTNKSSQTKKLGFRLAKEILKTKAGKEAFVLALKGELGSGKTAFLQGFAKGLAVKERVLSPTFVIMKRFLIPGGETFLNFYHFDCYRIGKAKELLDLGFKKIVDNPKNIIALEWAEKAEAVLPQKKLEIKFEILSGNDRKIIFQGRYPFLKDLKS